MKAIISIIIVNYKVKDKLFECIDSIFKSNPKTLFEIIVVDNDEVKTIEKELKKRFSKVKYIKSDKNLGYGAGNNLGAKYAQGDYLFFLNPDTLIINDAVEQLYRFIKSKNNIGIVSPLLIDNQLTPFEAQSRKELTPLNAIYSFSFLRKFFPKKSIYNDDFLRKWDKTTPIEVQAIPGAALMISKKLFDKVNGFDESFFLYFEENDLSKRIINLGFKLFIYPKSKIVHQVGQSTKNLIDAEKIFEKSRLFYLKKHYGILKALFVEFFLRINKDFFLILLILLLALFFRIYNLSQSMVFIGDQGWFYLSARDLLIQGKIPLVGITSSHTWLHQGPLWTYMLSIALFLFNFNPLAGGYLTAFFGAITTLLMYKLGSLMFSKKIGFISAALFAVSPLIVFFDRMPFDPSLIPFFTLLYLFSIFKWLKGNINYFPVIILLIALLYNLELATFTLFFTFVLMFVYGFVKNRDWARKSFNKKIIFYSLIAFVVPMLPVIIYDFSNGFKQTIVFLGWTLYKSFSFLVKHQQGNLIDNFYSVLNFLLLNIQRLVFQMNLVLAIVIFVLSLVYLFYYVGIKDKFKIESSRFILLFLLIVSFGGILINQTPSDAYLPIIFPFVIFLIALFFEYLLNFKFLKYPAIILLLIIIFSNGYSSFKSSFNYDFKYRIEAVEKIINLTGKQGYNLEGNGAGSQFKSFTMNYEYLLWWKGHPPTNKNVKLKIVVSETQNGIIIRRND